MHCGTIWVHGPALRVPVTEDEPRTAYGAYGTGKAEIEALLHEETRAGGVPAVVLHPGHISGPGWPVITPAGNLDPATWTALATGRPLALPDHGLGVLHHVHADDVAQAFELALSRPAAVGSSFHVAAEQAMTQRGLAAGAARWFGREPVLDFVGWEEFTPCRAEHAEVTREHSLRSITASIARARAALGYAPRYTALDALRESVSWLSPTARPASAASRGDCEGRQAGRMGRGRWPAGVHGGVGGQLAAPGRACRPPRLPASGLAAEAPGMDSARAPRTARLGGASVSRLEPLTADKSAVQRPLCRFRTPQVADRAVTTRKHLVWMMDTWKRGGS